MDCETTQLDIEAWVDGELDPLGEQRLRRHVEQCAACRTRLASVQKLESLLRSVPPLVAPRTLDRRVMANYLSSRTPLIPVSPLARRGGFWISHRAFALAGIVFIIIGMASFYFGWRVGRVGLDEANRPRVGLSAQGTRERGVPPNAQGEPRPLPEPRIRIIGRYQP